MANRQRRKPGTALQLPPLPPASQDKSSSTIVTLLPELPYYLEKSISNLSDDKTFSKRNLTSEEKATFCRAWLAAHGSLEAACNAIDISVTTAYHHLERDPDFQRTFSLTKLSLAGKIQAKSVERALTDNGVVDRMCQLKRFIPSVYREQSPTMQVGFAIGFSFNPPPQAR